MKSITTCIILILFVFVVKTEAQKNNNVGNELQSDKPNFILIVADDLGFADVGFNGSTQIKTPNIDQLASSGVRFSQGYVSSAVCSPSRAGLLTGINQVEFGHDNNLAGTESGLDPIFNGLPLSETTIADRLKALGYTTALIGKWHLGDLPHFHPLKRGFDEFWGYTGGGHDYFIAEPNGSAYNAPIECNYKNPQALTYLTDDKGDECVDFIKRHKNEPFFLFASFNAPHTPMQATEADLQLFEHVKNEKRRKYCAMVHRLDVNVGRIMRTLKKEGLYKNTLVVFISDNGGPCDQNSSLNAPFRGQKGILLEGGIHVPFVMNWPGTFPQGAVFEKPVISLDLAPTFLRLAGGEITDKDMFDGVDLVPFIVGDEATDPHEVLKWRFTISKAIRKGEWKLVSIPDRLPLLYHLPSDVSETNNVALEHIDKTAELLKQVGNWDVDLPYPLFLEGAKWKRVQLDLYDKAYQLTQYGAKPVDYLAELKEQLILTWPDNKTINIVFHGHSVPAGYFRTPTVNTLAAYPHLFLKFLKENYPTAVVNCISTSIGGEQSEQGALRFKDDVLTMKPDLLFIDYALNDRSIGLERAETAWRAMINEALAANVKLVLLTPTPDLKEDLLDELTPLAGHVVMIKKLGREYDLPVVDVHARFKELKQEGKDISAYMSQGNHPNELGHEVVLNEIVKELFNEYYEE